MGHALPSQAVGAPEQDHIKQRARGQDAVAVEQAAQYHFIVEVGKGRAVRPTPPKSQQDPATQRSADSGEESDPETVCGVSFSLQGAIPIRSTRSWRGGRSNRIGPARR